MDLHELTINKAHTLLTRKEISSRELTEAVLERIFLVDEKVGAYITVTGDEALKQADLADKEIARGNTSFLTGIPLSIKDIICTF